MFILSILFISNSNFINKLNKKNCEQIINFAFKKDNAELTYNQFINKINVPRDQELMIKSYIGLLRGEKFNNILHHFLQIKEQIKNNKFQNVSYYYLKSNENINCHYAYFNNGINLLENLNMHGLLNKAIAYKNNIEEEQFNNDLYLANTAKEASSLINQFKNQPEQLSIEIKKLDQLLKTEFDSEKVVYNEQTKEYAIHTPTKVISLKIEVTEK